MTAQTVPTQWQTIGPPAAGVRVFAAGEMTPATRAAAILLPAIHGASEYAQGVAQELAMAGYATLLVDIFAPDAPPDLSTPAAITAAVADVDDNRVLERVGAVAKHLKTLTDGKAKLCALGFCIGGAHALLAASEVEGIDAAVGFYGMLRYAEKTPRKPHAPIDRVARLRAPILYHVGDNDPWVDSATLDQYTSLLREHKASHEVRVYAGAGHAFHEHHRPVYRPVAARASWANTLTFMDWHLKGQRRA
jgi:carboxymethylenebutenolidase